MSIQKKSEQINLQATLGAGHKPDNLKLNIRAFLLENTLRKIPKNNLVLDLCCGWGFYFMINPNAEGVDGDPACALNLRESGKIITLANILKALPYKNDHFSHVISHDVFEHFELEELKKIFPEIHRILRPQGELIVLVPNRKGFDYGVRVKIGHKTYVTVQEIKYLIAGLFEIERHYPEPLPRFIGKWFTHNKEVFILRKIS